MFDMDMEESNGTRKLFQILIRLLDVVKNKKSIMMDEFDMGLHTRLADFILDLIHASLERRITFSKTVPIMALLTLSGCRSAR